MAPLFLILKCVGSDTVDKVYKIEEKQPSGCPSSVKKKFEEVNLRLISGQMLEMNHVLN